VDAISHGVEETARSLAADAARGEGVELIDLEFRREPVGWVLRLFIDKPGGVGLDDCRRVSEVVGTLLEVEDFIPHAYTLEVSSPGLTRPLTRDQDWDRALGRTIKVVTRQPIAGRQDMTGKLLEVQTSVLILDLDGTSVEVPRNLVARARLEVDWPHAEGSGGENRRRERRPSKK
jgi:ribosome maturation factor RimP